MKQNRGILREYICVTRLFTLSLSGLQQKSIQYSGLSLVCMDSKRSEHFFFDKFNESNIARAKYGPSEQLTLFQE